MSQAIDIAIRSGFALPENSTAEPIAVAAEDQSGMAPEYRAKVKQAAENFESFFIEQILHQMRRSLREIDPDDAENAKHGDNDMLDMVDTMLADKLSQRHAFGVADAILRQLVPANPQDGGLKVAPKPVALNK
jgi:flagellar protein FlgJ